MPSFYVWNGTLPYTTNGSTACATANEDTTTTLRRTNTWTESRSSSVYSTHTYSITRNVVGATPIPSVANLPTHSVYDLDKQDSKGWTYCYAFGHDTGLKDNFYSLFSGTLFEQARLNCSRSGMAVSPLVVVDAAAFLLDETTSYIDNPKTENSDNLRSRPTESSQTKTDVLVDPFQGSPKLSSAQKSAPSKKADSNTSTPTKAAQSVLPDTASQASSDHPVSNNQPVQTTAPSSKPKEPAVTASASKSPARDTEVINNANPQSSTSNPKVQSGAKVSVATPATPATSGIQIDALNSLIQDVGKLQSSSEKGAVISFAGTSTHEDVPNTTAAATTSVNLAPIVIGTSTATVNSDGYYMIGAHALQPSDSPYELQGTTYALDPSRSALIVNGISTYAVQSAQQASANDIPRPATLTINGITVTPNSASDYVVETQTLKPGGPAITVSGTRISLASDAAAVVVGSKTSVISTATTMGIGDYVWAGLAGMLSAASDSASSATTSPDEKLSAGSTSAIPLSSSPETGSSSSQSESLLSVFTSTASDGEIIVTSIFTTLSATQSSSNTDSSTATVISQRQTSTSHSGTDPETTSRDRPSTSLSSSPSPSSSSSLIETSPENNSGRVIVNASYAICILSLFVTIFA